MKYTTLALAPVLLALAFGCRYENELTLYDGDVSGQSSVGAGNDFEGETIGSNASGFTAATGDWRVVADSATPSGGRVLAQEALNDKPVFNVNLFDSPSLLDAEVSVQLKSIAGVIDQGGGVIWRAQDERNYYIARFNPLEDNYRVYYVKEGERITLGSATIALEASAWHQVKVSMQGDHIECYLNGKKLLDIHDSTFETAGKLGLWTKADAQTHFDDFLILPKSDS